MALNLNTLAGRTATAVIPFMGQETVVKYDPMHLTQANMETWQKSQSDDAIIEFFLNLVKDWDVQKGQRKVPLTTTGVKSVPMLLIRAIVRGILQSGATDVEEGKASNGGSPSKGKKGTHRTGTS